MTKSEAIEVLKKNYPDPCYSLLREAVDVAIEVLSKEQESYEDKLKEIADELSEKFAYMNTCLNERDIILGYLGVKRPSKIHCNTDCTNTKCESNHCYKKPLTELETSRIENALHGKSPEEQYDFILWLLRSYTMNFTDSRQAAIEWLKGEETG